MDQITHDVRGSQWLEIITQWAWTIHCTGNSAPTRK